MLDFRVYLCVFYPAYLRLISQHDLDPLLFSTDSESEVVLLNCVCITQETTSYTVEANTSSDLPVLTCSYNIKVGM